jgi:hypothetical protein
MSPELGTLLNDLSLGHLRRPISWRRGLRRMPSLMGVTNSTLSRIPCYHVHLFSLSLHRSGIEPCPPRILPLQFKMSNETLLMCRIMLTPGCMDLMQLQGPNRDFILRSMCLLFGIAPGNTYSLPVRLGHFLLLQQSSSPWGAVRFFSCFCTSTCHINNQRVIPLYHSLLPPVKRPSLRSIIY